jgi:hypothetical protein
VVEHWPIGTVHDVRGPLEPVEGLGFFWAQRFTLDGRSISLYALENRILRARFADARIHAAINCASASCPDLASVAYRPETLERQLDAAIELSAIFDWFRGDFVQHATREGWGNDVLDFVEFHAAPATRDPIAAARARGAEVRSIDYDWSLNER